MKTRMLIQNCLLILLILIPATSRAVAPGDPAACDNPATLLLGESINGSLSDATDCFVDGRLSDRYSLTLTEPTVFRVTVDATDFQPLVGARNEGGSRLLAARSLPDSVGREFLLPAGTYWPFATSNGFSDTDPPVGDYTLTVSDVLGEPQQGCDGLTAVVKGSVAHGSFGVTDCVSSLPIDEGRTVDGYMIWLAVGESIRVELTADVSFIHSVWIGSTFDEATGIVPANSANVFTGIIDTEGFYLFYALPGVPGETGSYTMTFSDALAISATERAALIDLYNATNGDSWFDNSGWLGDVGTECSWYGVTCGDGYVQDLHLQDNNLSGSIASSITDLDQLEILNLSNNQITGNVPASLLQQQSLQSLNLSNNPLNYGSADACDNPQSIGFGESLNGSLTRFSDCFLGGRLSDRYSLTLTEPTVFRVTVDATDFQPLVGARNEGGSRLLAARSLPDSVGREFLLPASTYWPFATSNGFSDTDPPVGDYTLTVSDALGEPQQGCDGLTAVVKGSVAHGSFGVTDCVSSLPIDEGRTVDGYMIWLAVGESIRVELTADVSFIHSVWIGSTFDEATGIVPANSSNVFTGIIDTEGFYLFYALPGVPGETGSYTMTFSDALAISATERAALIDLYNATNGDSWFDNSGWLGDVGTECSWYGVTCGDGYVQDLHLQDNNLSGSIASSITDLDQLEILNLSNNQITGNVPTSLFQQPSLQSLSLSNNPLNYGSDDACDNPQSIGVGESLWGSLTRFSDCFLGGRLVDRYSLTLTEPTVFRLNLYSPDFQPMVGMRSNGGTRLLAPLSNNSFDADIREFVLPAGTYWPFVSTLISNDYNPVAGNYWLGPVVASEPQLGCFTKASSVVIGSVANGSILSHDCRSNLPEDEGRTYDAYIIYLATGENVRVTLTADIPFIHSMWGPAGFIDGSGITPIAADTSNVITHTATQDGFYTFYILPGIVGDAGSYTMTFSDALAISATERAALIDLYNATNGDSWFDNSGWLGDVGTECSWYGVTCGDGYVQDLHLQDNNLSGSIASSITDLDQLEILNLSNNQITGNVPASLFQQPSLQSLNLSNNPLNYGSADACDNPQSIALGESVNGSLAHFSGCFADGRLSDRYSLTLTEPAVFNVEVNSTDFQPAVGARNNGGTQLLAALRGSNEESVQREYVLPAGTYWPFATTLARDDSNPAQGNYSISISNTRTEPQMGCLGGSAVVIGSVANGTVTSNDCESDLFNSEEDDGRTYDVYNMFLAAGEGIRVELTADIAFIHALYGPSGFIDGTGFTPKAANTTNVITTTASQGGFYRVYILPGTPGDSGSYTMTFGTPNAISSTERGALIDLYNATNGASWFDNSGWLGDVGTECSWYGVSCGDGYVEQLALQGNNLSGTISASITNLDQLELLDLSDNEITGNVPAALLQQPSLQTLSLINNPLNFGSDDACANPQTIGLGESVNGSLARFSDCFLDGRLYDMYSLTLTEPTLFLVTVDATDFQPRVGANSEGGSRLLATRSIPDSVAREFLLPAGTYWPFATTHGFSFTDPLVGDYTITISEALTEPQIHGCGGITAVVIGSVANGTIDARDCVSIQPADEGRSIDGYAIWLEAGEGVRIEMVADIPFAYAIWGPSGLVENSGASPRAANTATVISRIASQTGFYFIDILPGTPGDNGSYTMSFGNPIPAPDPDPDPIIIPVPAPAPAPAPTPTPTTGVTEINNDINKVVDTITVTPGAVVSEETITQVSAVLAKTTQLAENVIASLPAGTAGIDSGLSALNTMTRTLSVTGSVVQQGGNIDQAAVTKSLNDVASVLNALSSRAGDITPTQRATVQSLAENTVVNSANLITSSTSKDKMVALVASTSAVINAAANAGAALSTELVAQSKDLVSKVIKTGISSFGENIDPEDPAQVESLLRSNPDALEFAIAASVAVNSRINPDTGALENELSNRGMAASLNQNLVDVLNAVANPDGVSVNGVNATDALLSALVQLLSGASTQTVNGQAALHQAVLSSGSIAVQVDTLTGTLMITAPGEKYVGAATRIRIVSDSVPKGISHMRDGRGVIVADGLAIEISALPVDLIAFAAAIQEAGSQFSLNSNGAFEIPLQQGQRFVGVLAFDNLHGSVGDCGALQFTVPTGALNSAQYAFGMVCANGAIQHILPFVHDPGFYDSLADNGYKVSTDRNTGILSLGSLGRFKPGFFVEPLTSADQTYLQGNANSRGMAMQLTEINGDAINDYLFITPTGAQVLYGIAP